MNIKDIDKNLLKELIKEVLKEDISLFKTALKEILLENKTITSNAQLERRNRLEKLIDEDFEEYDEVFKALA